MRKLLVSSCFAAAMLFTGLTAQSAKAGDGHGHGHGGYGVPSCHAHYSGYGAATRYHTSVVPVFPGGIYQSYSYGGSPFGYSNYGQFGHPYGTSQYGVGYGANQYRSGYRNPVPRVQLRIGF